jgi:hypothetical protein
VQSDGGESRWETLAGHVTFAILFLSWALYSWELASKPRSHTPGDAEARVLARGHAGDAHQCLALVVQIANPDLRTDNDTYAAMSNIQLDVKYAQELIDFWTAKYEDVKAQLDAAQVRNSLRAHRPCPRCVS